MTGRLLRSGVLIPLVAGVLFVATGSAEGQGSDGQGRGEDLYVTGCSSCHGLDGEGVTTADGNERGPSLERAGGALTYFMLSTGRMPLADPDEIVRRKEPAYTPREIDALVEYVSGFGDGPPIPEVDPEAGDLAVGGEIYRSNCQACHSASGAGGALSYGENAPSLGRSTPVQVAAAVRTGPGEMPVFGPETISDEELDSLVRYVRYLKDPDDRGGISLGRLGPIPEGFLIWVLGMGLLIVLCTWIGGRTRDRRDVSGTPPGGAT